MRFALPGVFLAIALSFTVSALAQDTARVDCTPICGSPTCCIARTTDVAVCAIDGRQNVNAAQKAAAAGKGESIADACVGQPKPGHSALITADNLRRTKRLSCKWGCCPNNQAAAFAIRNADTLVSKVSDTETKSILQRLKENPAGAQKANTSLAQRSGAGFLCIFCCTF